MRIAITGATGLIGQALGQALATAGHQARGLHFAFPELPTAMEHLLY